MDRVGEGGDAAAIELAAPRGRRCGARAAGRVAALMPRFRSARRPAPVALLGAGAQGEQPAGGDRQRQRGHRAAVGEGAHAVEGERDAGRDRQAERGQARELGGAAAVGGDAHGFAGVKADDGVARIAGDLLRFHCSAA